MLETFGGIPFTIDRPLGHQSFLLYFQSLQAAVRAADRRGARLVRLEIRKGRLKTYASDGITIEYIVRPCDCCSLGRRMTCPDCPDSGQG